MALPVTLIGGYLGAGKTTLVNHLLRTADGLRLAVLVNEFGALPIDAELIEARGEKVISIAGGCVCCSYGSDLMAALMDLEEIAGDIDHVLIETSGVALPGQVARSVGLLAGYAHEQAHRAREMSPSGTATSTSSSDADVSTATVWPTRTFSLISASTEEIRPGAGALSWV